MLSLWVRTSILSGTEREGNCGVPESQGTEQGWMALNWKLSPSLERAQVGRKQLLLASS